MTMTEEAKVASRPREGLEVRRHETPPAGWDDFLSGTPDSTFCHLSGWREIFSDVLGHQTLYLVARHADGEWAGVLPLVRVRSLLFGDHLLSVPFLNYGGPLGTPAARASLAEAARDEAEGRGVDLLELRCRHELSSSLVRSDRKITVLLDLPDDPRTLWEDHLRSKVRSQVRRPRKEGMEARFGHDQLEPFYRVFARNMRDLGTPVLPRPFFERIRDVFPDRFVIGAVYAGERPVAAGCGFVWRDEFEITWASSLREYSRSAPNMLLYWSFMERMVEREIAVFNFGRCTPESGTHRFKAQWGTRDVPLPWLTWSPGEVSAPPSPEDPVYRLATTLWSRLPLWIANRVGPPLARRLP